MRKRMSKLVMFLIKEAKHHKGKMDGFTSNDARMPQMAGLRQHIIYGLSTRRARL